MKRSSIRFLLIPALLVVAGTSGIHAQPQTQPEENRYVVVPPEVTFLMIASQPGAPIGFKDMKLLVRIDRKRMALTGKIYNAGNKPIRYINLMLGGSAGGVSTPGGPGPMSGAIRDELLMPGEEIHDDNPPQIVPLTEDLKQKLNLGSDKPKGFFVLMVNSVTFDVGTQYTDEKTISSIRTYLEALGEHLETMEYSTKKPPQ